jgi:hypothetical protein
MTKLRSLSLTLRRIYEVNGVLVASPRSLTETYGPAIFLIPIWNQYEGAGAGLVRTTNSVACWHHSLQSLFMSQYPTIWTFLYGILSDCQLHKTAFVQASAGTVNQGKKTYRDLKARMVRVVNAAERGEAGGGKCTGAQAIAWGPGNIWGARLAEKL